MEMRLFVVVMLGVIALAGVASGDIGKRGTIDGRREFERRCATCHPNGGNTVNPARTLDKMTREANGVKSVSDIVRKMRKPGPGMTTFDRNSLPDEEAKAIAGYIIRSFP